MATTPSPKPGRYVKQDPREVEMEASRDPGRMLRDARKSAETCAGYANDARNAGDARLARFFERVGSAHAEIAGRAEELLGEGSGGPRFSRVPAQGDAADLSSGQDVAEPEA